MTFVPYPNITATSQSGEYRIDIEGKAADAFFRDQSHFVYRLYRSDELVWEWTTRNAEHGVEFLDDFPHDAWVSNDGWVVVRTHEWFHAGLMVFSPSGEVVLRRFHRQLLDEDGPGFLDGEPEEYMGNSSAGPFWAQRSLAHFSEQRQRPFWTLRTWWGRRVVIDLTEARFVERTEIDDDYARSLEIQQIQEILAVNIDTLEAQDEQTRYGTSDREFSWMTRSVLTAAYHAGWLQSTDSVPYLRRLEVLSYVGSEGFGSVPWATLLTLPFRQVAKTSLLRMGCEPLWLSHYQFCSYKKGEDGCSRGRGDLFEFPMQVSERSPHMLEIGLTQNETLHRIGAPDFIRDEWEYDFLSPDSASTVRVFWEEPPRKAMRREKYERFREENPPRIARIETVEPQWERITMRDHYITH